MLTFVLDFEMARNPLFERSRLWLYTYLLRRRYALVKVYRTFGLGARGGRGIPVILV